jgi:hypothetical protein
LLRAYNSILGSSSQQVEAAKRSLNGTEPDVMKESMVHADSVDG